MGIIDGQDWLAQRLNHLRSQLEAGPDDDQRVLIETEIELLEAEAQAGRRRFRQWLVWGGRRAHG